MQVDPIKPKLKPLGTERLKPNCDILLSTSAFKINLRRYTADMTAETAAKHAQKVRDIARALAVSNAAAADATAAQTASGGDGPHPTDDAIAHGTARVDAVSEAGAYPRSCFRST